MNTKSRCWMTTVHVENMKKAGLTEQQIQDYPFVLNFFLQRWSTSGKDRTACFTACVSAGGVFHLHGALYGEKTTRASVARLLFDSHVEPCKGGKTNLMNYIQKLPPYDEKGENVMYIIGKDNIRVKQGKRTDFELIEEMIDEGYTPNEIMRINFRYRKYEKMIKSAFAAKKLNEAPVKKQIYREWHVGESGAGKTYCYERLCQQYGPDEIYMSGYTTNGWLDGYMEAGAPPILFIDELKPSGSWQELLNVLDIYSQRAIHSRYQDIYPLWEQVIITSVYPPEEIHAQMVKPEHRKIDTLQQLMRRLDTVVYHFIENGVYKEFRIPASDYVDYADLKCRAIGGVKSWEAEELVSIRAQSST